ncbi:MAG: LacI family DNA-binding transcriptional regulator [Anaerolineae bacterium]
MAVRLKDISEQVGVSIATVSRVLNGREVGGLISEETRARILTVAAELGYRPNLLARGLRGSRSSLVGVIVRDIADPFMSETMKGIHHAAVKRGFRLFLGHVEQTANALDYGAMFEQSHADGILLLGDMNEDEQMVSYLTSKHQHIVAIVNYARHRKYPGVYADDAFCADMALDHLWSLGHRRIYCVAEQHAEDRRIRVQSYQKWMQAHGLAEYSRVISSEASYQAVIPIGKELFSSPSEELPTAIFAITDRIAIGLLQAAYQSGIAIPDQVSIVGVDNISISEVVIPPLTTVSLSPFRMGYAAADLLLDMIEKNLDSSVVQDLVLEPELIVRQSTAQGG